jgi:glycosyltransferase involved in cell wall biosynthesis
VNRICILVVSFNTTKLLLKTLDRIPKDVLDQVEEVAVFDDCSKDLTYDQALACQHRQGIDKIRGFRNPYNRGYGGTQKRGYQYALRRGFDVVVLLHGDGRYAPEHVGELLYSVIAGDVDMAVGSRMRPGCQALQDGMPPYKYLANRILTYWQNRITGLRLTDFHSGYRAYRCDALRKLPIVRNTDSWHFDTQVLLQMHAHGFRIQETSIPTFHGAETSPLNTIRYAFHSLWECLKFRITRWRLWRSELYDTTPTEYEMHDHRWSSHQKILGLLRSGSTRLRILDVGVATGYLDRELRASGHLVTGIEQRPEAAARARPFCDELLVGDVQALDLSAYDREFDRVVLADVLEHLQDPAAVMEKLTQTLKTGGRIIASVPNVANIYVRLNLLFGRFRYDLRGILDVSHMRFFTLRSFRELIDAAGLEILSLHVTPIPLHLSFPQKTERRWFRFVYWALYQATRVFKRLLAYQFILEAEKTCWLGARSPAILRQESERARAAVRCG